MNADTPAFPVPSETGGHWADPETCKIWEHYSGMSKREYFAALAMQGLLAVQESPWMTESDTKGIAVTAVAQADALIAALSKEGA